MTGPANPNPRALAMGGFAELEAQFGTRGWDWFEQRFAPAEVADGFNPDDRIKRWAAALWQSAEGREFLEYLLDLTCRAPYPVTSQSAEDLQFAAAKHQSRAAVGETLVKVISDGHRLLYPQEP